MSYKFMQIFGNCNDIFYLGQYREKGPVDNVITKTTNVVELLINNEYYDFLKNTPYKVVNNEWRNPSDPQCMFDYGNVLIVHNDIRTEQFWSTLHSRCDAFMDFLQKVKSDTKNYFVVTLTRDLVNQDYNTPFSELYSLINILSFYGLLSKTIFVQTDKSLETYTAPKAKWECKIDNWGPLQQKFNNQLKVITINYGSYNINIIDKLSNKFIKEFKKLCKGD